MELPAEAAAQGPRMKPKFRYLVTVGAIAIAYFAGARFGLSLAFTTKQVTALWPPTGVAVAALLLFGLRVWPAIAIGAFAINAVVGDSLLIALGIAVGNTAGPVLAVACLRRFTRFGLLLERVEEVGWFVVVGVMVGVITATNGVLALSLGGVVPWSAFVSVWWVWWIGDAMGVMIFAPFILSLRPRPRALWRVSQLLEAAVMFIGLVLVSRLALVGNPEGPTPFQIQYAVFPFIIWAGLRFDARSTASVVVLLAGFATWGATHNRGPFSVGNIDRRLILLDMFMAVATITGLFLNVATHERVRAEEALQQANDDLEKRVRERTHELEEARALLERQASELRQTSVTDELTGLLNRRGFMLIADQAIKTAARKKEKLVLFFVDLNGMKAINDKLGHNTGDRALADTASLLRRVFRRSDVLARLGGDEFVVLAIEATVDSGPTFAAKMRGAIIDYNATSSSFKISISVGTSVFDPAAPSTLERLLSEADAHMYKEKELYSPSGLNRIKLS
jgi:diguanylate cyclase (GGDEF)-like protein